LAETLAPGRARQKLGEVERGTLDITEFSGRPSRRLKGLISVAGEDAAWLDANAIPTSALDNAGKTGTFDLQLFSKPVGRE
jgi:hypothetical protein